YPAILQAAIYLVRMEFHDVVDNPDIIVNEFRTRFYDTNLLGDRYAGNKFAQYLFRRHDSPPDQHTRDHAHRIVEEAQLFIEAVYACRDSITERGTAGISVKPPVQVGKAVRQWNCTGWASSFSPLLPSILTSLSSFRSS